MKTIKSARLDSDIRKLFVSLELIPQEFMDNSDDEFYLLKFDTDEEYAEFKLSNPCDELGVSNWCVCYDTPEGKKKLFTNESFKNLTARRISEYREKMQEVQSELERFCDHFAKMDEYLKKMIAESL